MAKNVSSNPRVCTLCGKSYAPASNRQKYCVECRAELNKQRCTARYKNTYKAKGYNQSREHNNNWQGGVGTYRKIARELLDEECGECGSSKFLCVHHKDENRLHNDSDNLEILCRSCHAKRHNLHKNFS